MCSISHLYVIKDFFNQNFLNLIFFNYILKLWMFFNCGYSFVSSKFFAIKMFQIYESCGIVFLHNSCSFTIVLNQNQNLKLDEIDYTFEFHNIHMSRKGQLAMITTFSMKIYIWSSMVIIDIWHLLWLVWMCFDTYIIYNICSIWDFLKELLNWKF